MRIERLYDTESLTDNLTDADAKAILKWAEGQILQNVNEELVRAAVSAANTSGQTGTDALVAQANTFLTQQLAAQRNSVPPSGSAPSPTRARKPSSSAKRNNQLRK